jgi:hypothetical protein
MMYADRTEVKMGDRVWTSSGCTAIVVVSADTNEFDPGFSTDDWADLKTGIFITTETGAHCAAPIVSWSTHQSARCGVHWVVKFTHAGDRGSCSKRFPSP